MPPAPLTPAELARYSRHLRLNEIGIEGQQRLATARVLVVGAGGLGSPAALYLAAAGVGTLGIADFDRVEEHNLQRQLLHDTAAVGRSKVDSAVGRLQACNPLIRVLPHETAITAENALSLFTGYDLIVDGTDSFPARYLINDAAVLTRRPLIHGSVFKFEGQVAVFDPAHGGPCYRCLFPEPPPLGSVPDCGEAGVMGALCGVIGSLMALEAIKVITGAGDPLLGRLLTYDGLTQDLHNLRVQRNPDCPVCGDHPTLTTLEPENYDFSCEVPAAPSAPEAPYPLEVSVSEARRLLDAGQALVIDVREPYELQICGLTGAELIPMRQIPTRVASLPRDRHLLVLCHHGNRSLEVTRFLRAEGLSAVSNVAGGIDAWARQIDPSLNLY